MVEKFENNVALINFKLFWPIFNLFIHLCIQLKPLHRFWLFEHCFNLFFDYVLDPEDKIGSKKSIRTQFHCDLVQSFSPSCLNCLSLDDCRSKTNQTKCKNRSVLMADSLEGRAGDCGSKGPRFYPALLHYWEWK